VTALATRTRTEYRVVWQREGLTKRTVRYRSRAQALSKALVLQGRMWEVTDEDPDGYACCSDMGGFCGCGGITNAAKWRQRTAEVPPLVFGPIIQTREFTATPWVEA
jgi:hypothetical protein